MIDKQSPIPIYYQIEEQIKKAIQEGQLKPGDALPSEREMTKKYAISRMTVRQAMNNLVNEGYLYRQKGKGTFVAKPKITQPLTRLTSFSEEMRERGMKPSSRLLYFRKNAASKEIAATFNLKEGETVSEIGRIRLAEDEPIALEKTCLSPSVFREFTARHAKQSLYHYVETTLGLEIGYADQSVEAAVARPEEARHLAISPGMHVLIIKRTTYLRDGRPFETVQSVYRADRYKFTVRLHRASS